MAQIIPIEKLTLRQMIKHQPTYDRLSDGLIELPVPEKIFIGYQEHPVPQNLEDFSDKICYAQRLFLVRPEKDDYGIILRTMDGFYYPIHTGKKWDDDKALRFGKKILTLKVINLYPVALFLINLLGELVTREQTLLHREPTKQEKAAGINKLSIFSELNAIDFLRSAMNKTEEEVMLTPYNECLVRFMMAKEQAAYQERYYEILREESEAKIKSKSKSK